MIFALFGCDGADDQTAAPAAHSSKGHKTANSASTDALADLGGSASPAEPQPDEADAPDVTDPAVNGGETPDVVDPSADPGAAEPAAPSGDSRAPEVPAAEEDPTPATAAVPSYQVPVSTELVAFSRYRVGSVDWRVDADGETRLSYDLPADLIGKAQRLDFSGVVTSETTWSLEGKDFGTADCSLTDAEITCIEHLDGVKIDMAEVQKRVDDGKLAPQRLQVTKAFDADPIGILRFPAP